VPFKGSFGGDAFVNGGPPFTTIATVEVNATGNATQLGSFTLAIPHTVDFRALPPALPPWTSEGSYEFVAANGDTLRASFIGAVRPVIPGVLLRAVEDATITGGTGRFAGATGGFIVERFVHIPPPGGTRTTDGSFIGTISSPCAQ